MTLQELLDGWVDGAPALRLSGIGLDHRVIKPGDAYVAVKNGQAHGLDRAHAAVAAGAVAVIHDGLQTLPGLDIPMVEVGGLGDRLGELASRFYMAPSEYMTIAGVTGSRGKTRVSHYLAQSWQRVYGHAGIVGASGYGPFGQLLSADQGPSDAARLQQALDDCAKAGVEHLAMEVSSRSLQQHRCQTVQFDAAIFTGLDQDHSPFHADGTSCAAAMHSLMTDYAPSFAIINHDDDYGRQWFAELNGGMQALSFGLQKGAELRAEIRSIDFDGIRFRISGPWGAEEVRTGLPGKHNVLNLLAVTATMVLLGMPWHIALHQIELMQPVRGMGHETRRKIARRSVGYRGDRVMLRELGDAA